MSAARKARRPVAAHRAFAVTALLFACASSTASAYVRSTTDYGTPVFWPNACVYIQPDSAGSPDLAFDLVSQIITRSINNWQSATYEKGCSYMSIVEQAPAAVDAHLDNNNVIKFRTDKWCRPAEAGNAEVCYAAEAAAITTVFYHSTPGKDGDGTLIDADIELNNINFTFVVEPVLTTAQPRLNTSFADLENTLTHELGHFQGLDHTCWDHVQASPPIDDQGMAIPDCMDVPTLPQAEYLKITQAVMYNYAAPGETRKRTPKPDDIAGICGIYPEAASPGTCYPPGSGGCSLSGARNTTGEKPRDEPRGDLGGTAGRDFMLSLGALGLLSALALRRRRA